MNRSSDIGFHNGFDSVDLSNPHQSDNPSLENEVAEIIESIKRKARKELNAGSLLSTIISDIATIIKTNPQSFETLVVFIQHYGQPYSFIAEKRGCSKQAVYKCLRKLSERYRWIDDMMDDMSTPMSSSNSKASGGHRGGVDWRGADKVRAKGTSGTTGGMR